MLDSLKEELEEKDSYSLYLPIVWIHIRFLSFLLFYLITEGNIEMKDNKWTRFFDTIFKILVLNFLVFLFSVLGLFILGIFPAIAAMFATIKAGEELTWKELMHLYWMKYKKLFVKANGFGFGMSFLSFYLFLNTKICFQLTPIIFTFFGTLSLIALVLCVAFALNLFIFMEEIRNKLDFKQLCQYTIYALPSNILQMIIIFLFLLICPFFPAMILFGGVVVVGKVCLYLANKNRINLQSKGIQE